MRRQFLIAIVFACLGGCVSEPFSRSPLPILSHPDPSAMRDSFARTIPDRFTSDDTVIIRAPFHDDLAVLGVLNVDRAAGTYELYGLNPLGVEFFHVGGDRHGPAIRSAIPPLMAHQDLLLSIAVDIERMYFDLLPENDSRTGIESTRVIFSRKLKDGKLVKEFGDEPAVLLEKHLDGLFGPIWRVRYYEYRPANGMRYPHEIVMDNSRYHYQIIVKNRDWSVGQ